MVEDRDINKFTLTGNWTHVKPLHVGSKQLVSRPNNWVIRLNSVFTVCSTIMLFHEKTNDIGLFIWQFIVCLLVLLLSNDTITSLQMHNGIIIKIYLRAIYIWTAFFGFNEMWHKVTYYHVVEELKLLET